MVMPKFENFRLGDKVTTHCSKVVQINLDAVIAMTLSTQPLKLKIPLVPIGGHLTI